MLRVLFTVSLLANIREQVSACSKCPNHFEKVVRVAESPDFLTEYNENNLHQSYIDVEEVEEEYENKIAEPDAVQEEEGKSGETDVHDHTDGGGEVH